MIMLEIAGEINLTETAAGYRPEIGRPCSLKLSTNRVDSSDASSFQA
jgi:hypothetical protein